MAINVVWDNDDKTVIRYEFSGKWDWEEYNAAISTGAELVKALPYRVNLLIDARTANLLPKNALSHFGNSMKAPPFEFDLAVIVTKSSFVETIIMIFQRVYPKPGNKLALINTMDEARALLAEFHYSHMPSSH